MQNHFVESKSETDAFFRIESVVDSQTNGLMRVCSERFLWFSKMP